MVKKQFVIAVSDPRGQLPKDNFVGWVVQIPEDDNPANADLDKVLAVFRARSESTNTAAQIRQQEQLTHEGVLDHEFINQRFSSDGGSKRLNKLLNNQLDQVITDLNTHLWKTA